MPFYQRKKRRNNAKDGEKKDKDVAQNCNWRKKLRNQLINGLFYLSFLFFFFFFFLKTMLYTNYGQLFMAFAHIKLAVNSNQLLEIDHNHVFWYKWFPKKDFEALSALEKGYYF